MSQSLIQLTRLCRRWPRRLKLTAFTVLMALIGSLAATVAWLAVGPGAIVDTIIEQAIVDLVIAPWLYAVYLRGGVSLRTLFVLTIFVAPSLDAALWGVTPRTAVIPINFLVMGALMHAIDALGARIRMAPIVALQALPPVPPAAGDAARITADIWQSLRQHADDLRSVAWGIAGFQEDRLDALLGHLGDSPDKAFADGLAITGSNLAQHSRDLRASGCDLAFALDLIELGEEAVRVSKWLDRVEVPDVTADWFAWSAPADWERIPEGINRASQRLLIQEASRGAPYEVRCERIEPENGPAWDAWRWRRRAECGTTG